jgi:hypothetical protein
MNRRSRLRFKTDMTVTLTCLDPAGASCKARLANLSAHGLSLILGSELSAGTVVKVEWSGTGFVGSVVYCQPYGTEYLAGLQVEDPVYDAMTSAQNAKTLA